jgi:hypothetical protein
VFSASTANIPLFIFIIITANIIITIIVSITINKTVRVAMFSSATTGIQPRAGLADER